MAVTFFGKPEQFRAALEPMEKIGEWIAGNANQIQFRFKKSGSIVNWFPATGTVSFQTPPELLDRVTQLVEDALQAYVSKSEQNIAQSLDEIDQVASPSALNQEQGDVRKSGWLNPEYSHSEVVIAFVGAVGADISEVVKHTIERLGVMKYKSHHIRVSRDVIPLIVPCESDQDSNYARINTLMDAGNTARQKCGDNSVLSLGVAACIATLAERHKGPSRRRAYLVDSLKHPEEVSRLRAIYPQGFYLVGVHADSERRSARLVDKLRMTPGEAQQLMARDEDEHLLHGQRTSDTFHMSDFFVRIDGHADQIEKSVERILDILFGSPYITPTFDEYAMFMAFSASLRSADLSRQVGAVVTKGCEILATGANDCPAAGGGLYWAAYDDSKHRVCDVANGRDYMRGYDSNRTEQLKIMQEIVDRAEIGEENRTKLLKALESSQIADLTEYGRVVHAEMEALLSCSRNHVSSRGASLYCTTFPCHNCAKHIIAAGISRVVYVEPYPKSKALEFHADSIALRFSEQREVDPEDKRPIVTFEPFVGIGPRRFFDLFSMRLGSGFMQRRKNPDGSVRKWEPENARLRIQMLPASYVDLEGLGARMFNNARSLVSRKEGADATANT